MVCPIEDRHPSEPPTGQRRPDRLREDPAVDDAWNRDDREAPHEIIGREVAQALCGLIGAAGYPVAFAVCALFPLIAIPLVPVEESAPA